MSQFPPSNQTNPYASFPSSPSQVDPTKLPNFPYSGLGITSFILSILACGCILVVFVIAGIVESQSPGGMDENSSVAVMVGLGLFFAVFVGLVALGLGVGALFQSNRKKLFGFFGIFLSGLMLLGTLGIIVLGMMVS